MYQSVLFYHRIYHFFDNIQLYNSHNCFNRHIYYLLNIRNDVHLSRRPEAEKSRQESFRLPTSSSKRWRKRRRRRIFDIRTKERRLMVCPFFNFRSNFPCLVPTCYNYTSSFFCTKNIALFTFALVQNKPIFPSLCNQMVYFLQSSNFNQQKLLCWFYTIFK